MALTHKDLAAISDLLEVKLKAEIEPLRRDLQVLKEKVSGLEEKVSGLEEKVSGLEKKVSGLEEKVSGLEEKVQGFDQRLRIVEADLKIIKVDLLENNVLPRLQTIEECYTTTYHRYADGIEQIDEMQGDIATLKQIVTEHSRQLQKIS